MTMQGGKHEKPKHALQDRTESDRNKKAKEDADRLIELAKKVTK